MKIIELLNKIANGEETPNKIHYGLYDYKLVEYGETTKLYQCLSEPYELINIKTDKLNEEVEIIEEDKKIEKIDINHLQTVKKCNRAKILGKKINEIIDYLEEKE